MKKSTPSKIVPGEMVKLAKKLGRTLAWFYTEPEGYSDGTLFEANEVGLVLALRSTYYGGERSLEGRRYAYLISSSGSIGWVWVDNLEVVKNECSPERRLRDDK